MPRPLIISGKDPVPIVQEAGWAPGPVWIGAENLAPTRIRSLDHPARSQSLYRLSYLTHIMIHRNYKLSTNTIKVSRRVVPPVSLKSIAQSQPTVHVVEV